MSSSMPRKTVERLSLYRRLLEEEFSSKQDYVFSHELAARTNITSAQVRRDLMYLKISGSPNRGYRIHELSGEIARILGHTEPLRIAMIGAGRLGQGMLDFFTKKKPNLEMIAVFDSDDDKCGRIICGTRCYHVRQMSAVIPEQKIQIAILACPSEDAQMMTDELVRLGIKGIVNFTPTTLKVPEWVYVEDIDITTSVEKVGYFGK